MLSLFQRIPSVWIALLLGGFGALLYMRYLAGKGPENIVVRERIFSIVLVDILFSRLSGLILHPSIHIKEDLLSLLSGASSSGWSVGLIASILYTLLSIWRVKYLNRTTFTLLAEAVFSGSILYFIYMAYTDLNPFRMEDIFRIVGASALLWIARKNRDQGTFRPQWLWGSYGLMMLLTSAIVPHVGRILAFTVSQWIFLATIAVSIYIEFKQDLDAGVSIQHRGQAEEPNDNTEPNLHEK